MAAVTKDDIWKVVQMGLGLLVVPLAGWVWNMNVEVAELRNDLGDAEEVIAVLEKKIASSDDNAKNIIGIEKDIEYMKGSLGRIEQMVTKQ
jgi:hypothetical protein